MDQRIGFCTTADGFSIAYATLDGGGPPVLYVAGFPSHLEEEWQRPTSRLFLSTLAAGLTLVRYDMRGCGLSDRDVEDISIDALVKDLEAVADVSGFEKFALLGLGTLAGPIAITYAARHSERVSSLVLCSAFTRGAVLASPERQQTLIDYTQKFGYPVLEYVESANPNLQLDRTGRDLVHMAATPAFQASLLRTFYAVDVTELLPRVTTPATILHGRGDRIVPFAEGRKLAASLPRAEFVPVQGNTGAALTEQDDTLPAIRRALAATPAIVAAPAGGVIAVLFTDLVRHTEMMQQLGDARGRELLREHERITRETLRLHRGAEVKSMGDGFMASFGSVTAAVECAVAMQRAFAAWNEEHAHTGEGGRGDGSGRGGHGGPPLQVRVGINAGEPIADEGDLFGSTVIMASRVCAEASAGEILIPEPVRHLLAGKGVAFADRGTFRPKGFEDPVRLFQVRWE